MNISKLLLSLLVLVSAYDLVGGRYSPSRSVYDSEAMDQSPILDCEDWGGGQC